MKVAVLGFHHIFLCVCVVGQFGCMEELPAAAEDRYMDYERNATANATEVEGQWKYIQVRHNHSLLCNPDTL